MSEVCVYLNGRDLFVWDSETHLIAPGLLAPPMVCASYLLDTTRQLHQDATRAGVEVPGFDAGLTNRAGALELLEEVLRDQTLHIAGHNIAYDFGVLCAADPDRFVPLVFDAYEACRVSDTRIREKLILLALGRLTTDMSSGAARQSKFSLEAIYKERWRIDLSEDKKGTASWRLRYKELEHVPLEQWPREAVEYARGDAYKTHKLFLAQAFDTHSGVVSEDTALVTNEAEQAAAAWVLQLSAIWGIRTDPVAVSALAEKLHTNLSAVKDVLTDDAVGIFRAKDGTKNMARLRELIVQAYEGGGLRAPMTSPAKNRTSLKPFVPQVSTENETLLQAPAETQPTVVVRGQPTPVLWALASISADKHNLDTYIPAFSHGTMYPINPGTNELVESGRTSYYKPNLQNLPKTGGFRECVVPRPGWVLIQGDYPTIELVCLAEVNESLFGYSAMADALRAGKDLHLLLAANILGIPYEECVARYAAKDPEVKLQRQVAKHCNFGLGGGMGPATFVQTVWDQSGRTLRITEERARELKNIWLRTFPEMKEFFRYISVRTQEGGGECSFIQPGSLRVRGGTGYCDGCNTHFQGLAADGAKAAMFHISQEMYTGRSALWVPAEMGGPSPLYGARVTVFVHDEFLGEAREEEAPEAAERLVDVMKAGMEMYVHRVPVRRPEPSLMRRWSKDAETIRDESGRLLVWEPKRKEAA